MRKVKVGLEADIVDFVGPVKVATKSVDDLGDEVKQLDRDLDKVTGDAAKAAVAFKLLGHEADSAADQMKNLGHQDMGLAVLDAKIKTTRGEVRKLADEFAETGDLDVFKKLGDSQGRLAGLKKIRKDLADSVTDGVKDGIGNIGNAGSFPGLQAAAMHVGAAFAVPLLAAIGGALTGAVGFGVAGAGLAGAFLGDPERFGYAWGQTLRGLKDEFIDASKPFKNDLYVAMAGIGPLVQSWHLDRILGDAEKFVQPLVTGVEGFSTGIVKGIGALVAKGEPAVHALSDSMIILGNASASAMSSIADGAEGGADALRDLSTGVGLVIRLFGGITEAAEKAYGFVHDHPLLTAIPTFGGSVLLSQISNVNGLTNELRVTALGAAMAAMKAGDAFSAQGDNLSALTKQLNAANVSADSLAATYVNKLFTATMGLDQATLGVAESQTRLRETFEENAKTLKKHADQLDINTKQGQANRESVLASVTANMALYQSQIAAGMSAEDAANSYDDNTRALEDQLRKAHLTQGEIDGLIGKYRGVPKRVDTDIAIHGLTDAINNLDETLRLINNIHSKTVYVTVKTLGDNPKGQSHTGEFQRYGGIRHAAAGMVVPPSSPGTVLFGEPETGGEAFIPLQGITPARAAMLGQIAMSGYGYNVVPRSGGGMPTELVLHATFLDPHTGDVMRRQGIRWSLDRGRDPANFWTAA